jgi:tetratricopeptide (TPR) repeat protein
LIEKALKLDPQNIFTKFLYSATMHWAGRYDEAITTLKDILKAEPDYFMAMQLLPCAYKATGDFEEELRMWRSFMNVYYDNSNVDIDKIFESNLPFTIESYKKTLNQLADILVSQLENNYFDMFIIAIYYNNAGEKSKALDLLERSYEMHNPQMPFLLNPVFDDLRNEARYQELCKKLNLQLSI